MIAAGVGGQPGTATSTGITSNTCPLWHQRNGEEGKISGARWVSKAQANLLL